jgi:hypothetical protein
MLIPPAVRVLAVVPWDQRYDAERRYTIALRARYPLLNIADGPCPLVRGPLSAAHKEAISAALTGRRCGPMTPEHKAKISASLRARKLRGEAESPSLAAA